MGGVVRVDFQYTNSFRKEDLLDKLSELTDLSIQIDEYGSVLCEGSKSKIWIEIYEEEKSVIFYDGFIKNTFLRIITIRALLGLGLLPKDNLILTDDGFERFQQLYNLNKLDL